MLITIVTFNPNLNDLINTVTKIKRIDSSLKIAVIDNNSSNQMEIEKLGGLIDYLFKFDRNYGVGKAYNFAIKLAKDLNQEWIMFLDQDTGILDNFNPNMIIDKVRAIKDEKIVIISINPLNSVYIKNIIKEDFYEGKMVVNSGMILNVSYGISEPFCEELFLDRIDSEYCLRSVRKGFKILVYREQMIKHKPGERGQSYKTFLGKLYVKVLFFLHKDWDYTRFTYLFYSNKVRYYLLVRNDIWLLLREKVPLSWVKIIIGDFFVIYDRMGIEGVKLFISGALHGVIGDLQKDNYKRFQK
ncbi:glycosyl transferase family 2 [Sulfolobales archaeon HS-7]|nr:glycosyl transferase family 2 [Sulfolobales archaeon HS-7]